MDNYVPGFESRHNMFHKSHITSKSEISHIWTNGHQDLSPTNNTENGLFTSE